eukprot:SAG31_NODE_29332_length_397_cov_0.523490_1_plen_113_part_10
MLNVKFPLQYEHFVQSLTDSVRLDVFSLLSFGDMGLGVSVGCMTTGRYYRGLLSDILLVLGVLLIEGIHTAYELRKMKKGKKEMSEEENRMRVQTIFDQFDKDGDGVELEEVA